MKQKRNSKIADETFSVPGAGFRMERKGRFISMETQRNPEEQKRLLERLADFRPKFLEGIESASRELLEIVHKFNSLELLAQIWFQNSICDPNEYKEYSFEGRMHYVEHLALLELRDHEYQIRTVDTPGREEIEKAQELLGRIFQATMFYYGSESLDPPQPGPIPRLDQLRFDTILHELVVRSPTYYSHHADILKELFGKQQIQEWMEERLGFNIGQALRCIEGVSEIMMNRLYEKREKAMKFATELKAYVTEFKTTGKFTGPEEIRDAANRLRNMRGKEAKRAIQSISIGWAFYDLHATCSFAAEELAEEVGIELTVTEKFLKCLSLEFGSIGDNCRAPR